SGLLRRTLATMRKQFGVLLGDTRPIKISPGRYKLYDDVRAELYGWPNEVDAAEYRTRVDQACDFLDGKSREWLAELHAEMKSRAEKQEFEKAAELRDIVLALERTLARTRKFTRDLTRLRPDEEALRSLQESLGLEGPPEHME